MRATSVVLALPLLVAAAVPAAASPTNIVERSPVSPVETGQSPPAPTPPPPPPPAPPAVPPRAAPPMGSGAPASLEPMPAQTDHQEDDGKTVSYRKYTVVIDSVSVALIIGGRLLGGKDASAVPQAISTVGLIGGAFGVPALHGARGHAERAARSMGLRLGAGALGLYVQSKFTGCAGFLQCLDPNGPGIVIGAVTASAIDALFMTSEHHAAPALAPIAIGTRGGGMLGVAGAF
jgi:hypothetical protein